MEMHSFLCWTLTGILRKEVNNTFGCNGNWQNLTLHGKLSFYIIPLTRRITMIMGIQIFLCQREVLRPGNSADYLMNTELIFAFTGILICMKEPGRLKPIRSIWKTGSSM